MKHTLDRVINKPTDYKMCNAPETDEVGSCEEVNWYENEECFFCGSTEFREPRAGELEQWAEEISEGFDDGDFTTIEMEVA